MARGPIRRAVVAKRSAGLNPVRPARVVATEKFNPATIPARLKDGTIYGPGMRVVMGEFTGEIAWCTCRQDDDPNWWAVVSWDEDGSRRPGARQPLSLLSSCD